ncbi:hypothetical protein ACHAXS_001036 [Conticribra weissflogii]
MPHLTPQIAWGVGGSGPQATSAGGTGSIDGFRMFRAIAEEAFLEWYSTRDMKTKHMLAIAYKADDWLMTLPQRLNGTKMCNLEFQNALQLHYNFHPLGLDTVCNVWGGIFGGTRNEL